MNINERIHVLRCYMQEQHIDAYIIPSADNHQSEYVGEHFKCRAFMTGFTGSAGTAVVTQDEACLWTDGRYFIQAEDELKGSEIKLYKMGNEGVPTIKEYLDQTLPENSVIGFDGRVLSVSEGKRYENFRIYYQQDLVNAIWQNRPSISKEPLFLLDERYTGESTASKLARVRSAMKKATATAHLLITLDDIAWLLNFRGRDTDYTPVALCYAVITMDTVYLFIDKEKVSSDIEESLAKDGVQIHPYNDVYDFASTLSPEERLLIDPERMNYALYHNIPKTVTLIEDRNPCILYKAMKNEVEIENIRKAHLKDGIAHTKFMHWIKTNFDKEPITELTASDKLEALRREQPNFLWPSFEPICAYGEHGAIVHYSSTEETDCLLEKGSFLLTDTGGNYMEGTTDITRTIALGDIEHEMKQNFTTVLRGNLALSRAIFPYGTSGQNLDVLARQYLWENHQDFNHGTGHGVGYLLSVHEPGCRISRHKNEETMRPLESGMVITDEPGLYLEGKYGIRLENELLVREDSNGEFGHFMKFEVLTYVPFDLDAIDVSLLTEPEKEQLNAYHKQVYDMVSPYLDEEEATWLKIYTRRI